MNKSPISTYELGAMLDTVFWILDKLVVSLMEMDWASGGKLQKTIA